MEEEEGKVCGFKEMPCNREQCKFWNKPLGNCEFLGQNQNLYAIRQLLEKILKELERS